MRRADSLFVSGAYFEASIAFERVYFEANAADSRVNANLKKAQALKQLGEYGKALGDLRRSLTFRGEDALRRELLYEMAFCAYMDGNPDDAYGLLQQFRHHFGQDSGQRVYLLEGLILAELQQWDELGDHLHDWVMSYADDPQLAQQMVAEYDTILLEAGRKGSRDPEKARMWSTFVPGAGQLYAGEPGWGALNVASQLVSLGAFALMAWNGYYIASVFAGLGPFQAFYFGGIRQAGMYAEAYEKSRREKTRAAVAAFLFDVAEIARSDR
ncbi:MAG: tetratricopeptide repeat protein [Bacteroidales bacterium]